MGVPVYILKHRQRVTGIPKDNRKGYIAAKRTLVVSTVNTSKFLSSKPSADYQLPLLSGCAGFYEYCYLNTTLGKRPYITVFANQEEILARAGEYIKQHPDQIVTFEGSCTSDPPTEAYTRALTNSIIYFAQ